MQALFSLKKILLKVCVKLDQERRKAATREIENFPTTAALCVSHNAEHCMPASDEHGGDVSEEVECKVESTK